MGEVESRDVQAPVQIPLKSLFSLGNMHEMPMQKMGRGTIDLELNIAGWDVTQNVNVTNQDDNNNTEPVTATHTGTTLRTLVLKNSFPNMDYCPYYVGQVLVITAGAITGGGALTAYGAHAKIIKIDRGIPDPAVDGVTDADNKNRVILTFGADIFSGLTTTSSTIAECTLEVFAWTSAEFRINSAEIVLKRLSKPDKNIQNSLTYTTFTTEQLSVSDESNFQRQFILEPSCVNAFLMFPDGDKLISNKTTMKTYRFRIDNIDVVNRDINVENDGAPNALHYELLMRTFVNAGIHVKSFLELARSANDDDTLRNEFLTSTSGVIILGCPTPLTDTKKMLQVNITTDTGNGEGINQLALFKQVVRTVKF